MTMQFVLSYAGIPEAITFTCPVAAGHAYGAADLTRHPSVIAIRGSAARRIAHTVIVGGHIAYGAPRLTSLTMIDFPNPEERAFWIGFHAARSRLGVPLSRPNTMAA